MSRIPSFAERPLPDGCFQDTAAGGSTPPGSASERPAPRAVETPEGILLSSRPPATQHSPGLPGLAPFVRGNRVRH